MNNIIIAEHIMCDTVGLFMIHRVGNPMLRKTRYDDYYHANVRWYKERTSELVKIKKASLYHLLTNEN